MADVPPDDRTQPTQMDVDQEPPARSTDMDVTNPQDNEPDDAVPPQQAPLRRSRGPKWWSQPTGHITEMYILDSRQPLLKIHVASVDQGDGNTTWQVDLVRLHKHRGPAIVLCWNDGVKWYENIYGGDTCLEHQGLLPGKRELQELIADDSLQELAQSFLDGQYHHDTMQVADVTPTKTAKKMRRRLPGSPFSMMEAFNDHHDLLMSLVTFLDIPTLISLYAIDKRFHFLFNCHHTAYIVASMRTWARGSELIYPWRSYKKLCIADPMDRLMSKWEDRKHMIDKKYQGRRAVPGFKWLQMVCYREAIVKDILIQLALENLRCPPDTSSAIKRMWYMLDMPLNTMRIALIHSETYFTNKTLENLTCFFLKVDMFFSDASGRIYRRHTNIRRYPADMVNRAPLGVEMREYLLHERQLTPLWRVLHGWSPDPEDPQLPINRLDIVRMWVRHKFRAPEDALEEVKTMSVLGVPWWEQGKQRYERSYVPVERYQPRVMLRPDELVMLEGMRRKLCMHQKWVFLAAYGMWDVFMRPYPDLSEHQMYDQLMATKIGT